MGRGKRKGRTRRFGNSWCEEFSTPRKIGVEQRLIEARKKLDADGDDIGTFFFDHRDTSSPLEVEVLEGFCRGTSLKDVEEGQGPAGNHKSVWIDQRNSVDLEGNGDARCHENPLTGTGLLRALSQPRFNHEKLHDATRRLIYIADLSPACIQALAATASSLHAGALRNAIYKHLSSQVSIAVKIASAGCLTFQLDLHLPFFILRRSAPPSESQATANKKPRRDWIDVSFLRLDNLKSELQPREPKEVWGLQEAQMSVVITGSDDWRWIGYGFFETEVDGLLTDDLNEPDMDFDQVAAGELEANLPIWRPRDYWVTVFEIRIEQIRREYEYVVFNLELAVKAYMNAHPSTLSRRPGIAQDRTIEMKAAFDWALQMMDLLRRIYDVLSATVKAWRSFKSPDGDMGYFSDPDADVANMPTKARYRSLQNIKVTFRQLEEYEEKIFTLNKSCSDYQNTLKIRLNLDRMEAANKNEFTSVFTVLFLYPIALAAAIFSMQQEALPFEQSPRSFVITIFILIVIVYITQLFSKHALPSILRRAIAWWIKRDETEEACKTLVEGNLRGALRLEKGLDLEKTLSDGEKVSPKSVQDTTRA